MEDIQRYENTGIGGLFDLSFSRFITLGVIKALYLLGLVVIGLGWLLMIISSIVQGHLLPALVVIVLGTLMALLYVIFLRVGLELVVVIFRIGENTSKLANRGDSV
ncbi:MAG: DUF4282 domain-containing protein [Phycisphaeraceae bacterium]